MDDETVTDCLRFVARVASQQVGDLGVVAVAVRPIGSPRVAMMGASGLGDYPERDVEVAGICVLQCALAQTREKGCACEVCTKRRYRLAIALEALGVTNMKEGGGI